jgi:hypothetical protein
MVIPRWASGGCVGCASFHDRRPAMSLSVSGSQRVPSAWREEISGVAGPPLLRPLADGGLGHAKGYRYAWEFIAVAATAAPSLC